MSFSSLTLSYREQLSILVEEFNESRLELFHLSDPNEELDIEGVMRFYFQDCGDRVVSKCIRVCSNATAKSVIESMTDKFLTDRKDGTMDDYSLWEVHESGEERRMEDLEKPLIRQLYWFRDDREGRFFIRCLADKNGPTEISPKTFTRTLTNPEGVMKRRREQKLKEKLMELTRVAGARVKIFGSELVPCRPYVTLLVKNSDSTSDILAAALEKYGLVGEETDFVLTEVQLESERTLKVFQPDEFPLTTMTSRRLSYFSLRRALPEYRVAASILEESIGSQYLPINPALAVLQQDDHSQNPPQLLLIRPGVTEVGSDKALQDYSEQTQNIYIEDPNVDGRHCSITFEDDIVTITPASYNPAVYVNNLRIAHTEILKNGDMVSIGRNSAFIFLTDAGNSE